MRDRCRTDRRYRDTGPPRRRAARRSCARATRPTASGTVRCPSAGDRSRSRSSTSRRHPRSSRRSTAGHQRRVQRYVRSRRASGADHRSVPSHGRPWTAEGETSRRRCRIGPANAVPSAAEVCAPTPTSPFATTAADVQASPSGDRQIVMVLGLLTAASQPSGVAHTSSDHALPSIAGANPGAQATGE